MYGGLYVGLFFFLAVASVALFTFVGVAAWSGARMQERVEMYRTELLKKVAEQQGDGARQILAILRHESLRRETDKRHGILLGGMITAAVGVALMALIYSVNPPEVHAWTVGLFPFLIGVVLMLFAWRVLRPGASLPGLPELSGPSAPPPPPAMPTPSSEA
jgi:hypothetical protein